jgi:hypothetical protein
VRTVSSAGTLSVSWLEDTTADRACTTATAAAPEVAGPSCKCQGHEKSKQAHALTHTSLKKNKHMQQTDKVGRHLGGPYRDRHGGIQFGQHQRLQLRARTGFGCREAAVATSIAWDTSVRRRRGCSRMATNTGQPGNTHQLENRWQASATTQDPDANVISRACTCVLSTTKYHLNDARTHLHDATHSTTPTTQSGMLRTQVPCPLHATCSMMVPGHDSSDGSGIGDGDGDRVGD